MRGLVCLIFICLCAVAASAAKEGASNSTSGYNTEATATFIFECGWQAGFKKCADGRCCSQHGFCGSTAEYCSNDNNCQSLCWTPDGGASNVIAYYHLYDAKGNHYNLTAAGAACAKWDGDRPYWWRSKYGWTAFCGPVGPSNDQDACGKCVRVINRETRKQATVRVVEGCTSDGFVLDYEVFHRLDTRNGEGLGKGHIFVDYHFVECGGRFSRNDKVVSA